MTSIGTLNGFEVIVDKHIQDEYKYPSGYKDGNRLGKRKRNLLVEKIIVAGGKIICSEKAFKTIKEKYV